MGHLPLPANAGEQRHAGGEICGMFDLQRDPLFGQRRLQAVKVADHKRRLARCHTVLAPLPWRGDK